MKHLLRISYKLKFTLAIVSMVLATFGAYSQCTPLGDQTTYGTSDTWIGYVYQGVNFNTYKGYVNQGTTGNPNFDQSFGGNRVNYATNGCTVLTDTFSVRYKLTKNFSAGSYVFTTGGDDGYRLSLDGGATWVINNWNTHSYITSTYTATLNGSYDLVFEYYENLVDNRVTFNISTPCGTSGDPAVYGTSSWTGYVYSGMNFGSYRGYVTEGTVANPNFDQNFGGSDVSYATTGCPVTTNQFSVRYRLQKTFADGTYTFLVGGDDGYRLSLDGGATYVINRWADLSYNTTSYTITMSGTRDVVLEYYENTGSNRISFNMTFAPAAVLPIKLLNWSAALTGDKALLQWKTAAADNFSHFLVQRSTDGASFITIKNINYNDGNTQPVRSFSFKDSYNISSNTFYRLAMVDKDGKMEYSSIIRLSSNSRITETKLYPTVVENGRIFIESSQETDNARLEVYSMAGIKVSQVKISLINGRQEVNFGSSFSGISTGSYVVLLSDSKGLISKKVIFVK